MLVIKSPWWLLPGLFIYGLGLGLIASQIVNLVMSSVDSKQTAEASGLTSTLETLGSSVGTAIIGTVLVVSLTNGVGRLVNDSVVFSDSDKTKITSNLSSSIEVVSNDAVSSQIKQSGDYKKEVVRIYDEARKNAFIITLLFMSLVAALSFGLSKNLPDNRAPETII
jgi:hypothetical protein